MAVLTIGFILLFIVTVIQAAFVDGGGRKKGSKHPGGADGFSYSGDQGGANAAGWSGGCSDSGSSGGDGGSCG